jgi:hypothetical protein
MPLERLGTPAFIGETRDFQRGPDGALTDFGRAQAAAWSDMISRIADRAVAAVERDGRAQQPGYRSRFFNPLRFDPVGGHDPVPVFWEAFPKRISDFFDGDEKWSRAAEFEVATAGNPASRLFEVDAAGRLARRMDEVVTRSHDEYLEWHEHRDAQGRITRISFTCEPPEYWEFLGNGTPARPEVRDRKKLLELYRALVGPQVVEAELYWRHDVAILQPDGNGGQRAVLAFAKDDYNPFNRFNVREGAVHLTQRANTLGAEIVLGASASVLRRDAAGRPVKEASRLICCSGFGEPNRSSDPGIGAGVNGIVAAGGFVTLADPIGLYIGDADISVVGPGGEDVSSGWRVERGDAASKRVLHASFAVPAGRGFTVSDCSIGGNRIVSGGQFAERIGMVLFGQRSDAGPGGAGGAGASPRLACPFKGCVREEFPSLLDIVGADQRCRDISNTEHWRDAFEEEVVMSLDTTDRAAAVQLAADLRHGVR